MPGREKKELTNERMNERMNKSTLVSQPSPPRTLPFLTDLVLPPDPGSIPGQRPDSSPRQGPPSALPEASQGLSPARPTSAHTCCHLSQASLRLSPQTRAVIQY